jgi:cytochrome c oxidase cbb3-type subunit IV
MTYETIASISQVTSLLMFVAMFAAVLVYAMWPSNGPRFDAVQRSALGLDQSAEVRGGDRDQNS